MINIDSVYQTVQALANKEQRGYVTPQEFNLFVNQAVHDIFEQYFFDLNAFRERRPQLHELGDSVTELMRKIRRVNGTSYSITSLTSNGAQLPTGHIGKLFLNQGGLRRTLKLIDPDEIQYLLASKWHKKGFTDAVYFEDGDRLIQAWDKNGKITSGLSCERITGKPNLAYWGYMVVNESPVYDSTYSEHIDLSSSERSNIIVKILKLAGISIEDPQLYQAAAAEESQNLQQENK